MSGHVEKWPNMVFLWFQGELKYTARVLKHVWPCRKMSKHGFLMISGGTEVQRKSFKACQPIFQHYTLTQNKFLDRFFRSNYEQSQRTFGWLFSPMLVSRVLANFYKVSCGDKSTTIMTTIWAMLNIILGFSTNFASNINRILAK